MVVVPRQTTPHAVVLIAVKPLTAAKTRLAQALSAEQRAQLTLAMLTDVLEAARGAAWTRAIAVVTEDARVKALAEAYGAVALDEPEAQAQVGGLNAALQSADAWARDQFPAAMRVALHGDLPALRPMELQQALCAARELRRAYVADHEGSGTTALIAAASTELAPAFGPGSAARHAASGAVAVSDPLPGLRQDVDVPGDLRMAAELGLGLATKTLVSSPQHIHLVTP
ncbi:MAG: 2-phospho-L-lactate guanylyltransferase [Segniliparus sp.]|uniref:2-phospho-L-lactate guanylyltransferase n=1 Tax=Segniliparus sp. TaxID=2804064 RepID=UPI003F2EE98D